jgi:hypothetical protein
MPWRPAASAKRPKICELDGRSNCKGTIRQLGSRSFRCCKEGQRICLELTSKGRKARTGTSLTCTVVPDSRVCGNLPGLRWMTTVSPEFWRDMGTTPRIP